MSNLNKVHKKNVKSDKVPGRQPDGKNIPVKTDVKIETTIASGDANKHVGSLSNVGKTNKNLDLSSRPSLYSFADFESYLRFMDAASKIDRIRCARGNKEYASLYLSQVKGSVSLTAGSKTPAAPDEVPVPPTVNIRDSPPLTILKSCGGVSPDISTKGFKTVNVTMFCKIAPTRDYTLWVLFGVFLCRWPWTSLYPLSYALIGAYEIFNYFLHTTLLCLVAYFAIYFLIHVRRVYFLNPSTLPFTLEDILSEGPTSGTELLGTRQVYTPISRLKDFSLYDDFMEMFYPGTKPINRCMLDSLGFTHYHSVAIYQDVYQELKSKHCGVSATTVSIMSSFNEVNRTFSKLNQDILLDTCGYFVQRNEICSRRASFWLGNSAKPAPLSGGKA